MHTGSGFLVGGSGGGGGGELHNDIQIAYIQQCGQQEFISK